ncbi:MAG: hypothetical protein ACK5LC_01265 [Coprobacillaceae bacterium]
MIALFFLLTILIFNNLESPVLATNNRNTETIMSIPVGESGWGFPVRKVSKDGEILTGSQFIGYHTDETFELHESNRMTDIFGSEWIINPDNDSQSQIGNSNLAMVNMYSQPTHIVIKEITAPDGYESETGKLYYFIIGELLGAQGRKLHIAPQSQDDAYFTDDGFLVLENKKDVESTPPPIEEPIEVPSQPDTAEDVNNEITNHVSPPTADNSNALSYLYLLLLASTTVSYLIIKNNNTI